MLALPCFSCKLAVKCVSCSRSLDLMECTHPVSNVISPLVRVLFLGCSHFCSWSVSSCSCEYGPLGGLSQLSSLHRHFRVTRFQYAKEVVCLHHKKTQEIAIWVNSISYHYFVMFTLVAAFSRFHPYSIYCEIFVSFYPFYDLVSALVDGLRQPGTVGVPCSQFFSRRFFLSQRG
jgi:hypothetical protein